MGKQERRDKAYEMLELVGIQDHWDKYAQYPILSGGQLQRVAIARNLLANSEMLLMDEPFGALDVVTRHMMQDLLCNIWTKMPGDPTVVLVTHDLHEAVYLADEIFVLNSNPGRVEEFIKVDLPLRGQKNFLTMLIIWKI